MQKNVEQYRTNKKKKEEFRIPTKLKFFGKFFPSNIFHENTNFSSGFQWKIVIIKYSFLNYI